VDFVRKTLVHWSQAVQAVQISKFIWQWVSDCQPA